MVVDSVYQHLYSIAGTSGGIINDPPFGRKKEDFHPSDSMSPVHIDAMLNTLRSGRYLIYGSAGIGQGL